MPVLISFILALSILTYQGIIRSFGKVKTGGLNSSISIPTLKLLPFLLRAWMLYTVVSEGYKFVKLNVPVLSVRVSLRNTGLFDNSITCDFSTGLLKTLDTFPRTENSASAGFGAGFMG